MLRPCAQCQVTLRLHAQPACLCVAMSWWKATTLARSCLVATTAWSRPTWLWAPSRTWLVSRLPGQVTHVLAPMHTQCLTPRQLSDSARSSVVAPWPKQQVFQQWSTVFRLTLAVSLLLPRACTMRPSSAGKSSFDVQLPATYEVLSSAVNTSLQDNVAAGSHRLVGCY